MVETRALLKQSPRGRGRADTAERGEVDNCTLGHSDHRHGREVAWERGGPSERERGEGVAASRQCLLGQRKTTAEQLLIPDPVSPESDSE